MFENKNFELQLQFKIKFIRQFFRNSPKFRKKSHLKLISCHEIPRPLYETIGNFMLFKIGHYEFYSKLLHFREKLKKTNRLHKKQLFPIHNHCFSHHQMPALPYLELHSPPPFEDSLTDELFK